MIPLLEAGDGALTWEQSDQRGKRFELRAGTALIAMLELPNIWKSTATAHAADRVWTLQRAGFARPHLLIRSEEEADNVATFAGAGQRKSQVTLRDGRVFLWQPARGRGTRSAFLDEAGQTAITFTDVGTSASRYRYTVQIAPVLRDEPTGTLLAVLGLYLNVEAVTAAMIAATLIISAGV